METCEVLIVGGGPSGSSCAWKLRQAGVDVMVLDKAEFPRHKVCGGWITPAVLSELDISLDDYQQQHVIQPITHFLTGMIGGREVETNYERAVSYGIRRIEFDDYLLRRAGARLRLGEAFRSIREEPGSWVVNDAIQAAIVIGAGGHFCPVSRHFSKERPNPAGTTNGGSANGHSHPANPVVVAQEVEFEMSAAQRNQCTVLKDRPELFFCPDLQGYGWIFRKGDWLNIGLGRANESHLTSHVSAFVKSLQTVGKIPLDSPDTFHGHAYQLRTHLPEFRVPDGILIIGDAAGLADQQSGEGIRPAIESGLLAAITIIEARTAANAQDKGALAATYAKKLRERFENSSRFSGVSMYIPSSVKQVAARWLMSTRWFNRRVLLDRWFLHATAQSLQV